MQSNVSPVLDEDWLKQRYFINWSFVNDIPKNLWSNYFFTGVMGIYAEAGKRYRKVLARSVDGLSKDLTKRLGSNSRLLKH